MITPSFGLTATERVLPKLALDFTTATLDSRVTFTRSGNTATYTNPSGVITAINANLPRFDYNPTTLACQGLLIEEARTNLLLNSLIDGTLLTTQSVTVAATAYTLSFYGTGSINLSGTHTATVTGTGAYPSRKTYTFTPTAGTLTLTVTGTVQYAQLEAGSFATSFIPTSVASVTRNADVATMTGTNFSSWYNASEGSAVVGFNNIAIATSATDMYLWSLTNSANTAKRMSPRLITSTRGQIAAFANDGTSFIYSVFDGTYSSGNAKCALAYKLVNRFGAVLNGGNVAETTSGTLADGGYDKLIFGASSGGANIFNGWLRTFNYYPQSLTNAEIQAFSK